MWQWDNTIPVANPFFATPPNPDPSTFTQLERPGKPSYDFLQQDNKRLLDSNNQLRDEVDGLRKRHGKVQAQLNELRDSLGPLDRSLQELLYEPATQRDGEVTGKIFAISLMVVGMKKILASEGGER